MSGAVFQKLVGHQDPGLLIKLIEKVNLFGVIGKVLSTLGDTTQEQKYLNDLYN